MIFFPSPDFFVLNNIEIFYKKFQGQRSILCIITALKQGGFPSENFRHLQEKDALIAQLREALDILQESDMEKKNRSVC